MYNRYSQSPPSTIIKNCSHPWDNTIFYSFFLRNIFFSVGQHRTGRIVTLGFSSAIVGFVVLIVLGKYLLNLS